MFFYDFDQIFFFIRSFKDFRNSPIGAVVSKADVDGILIINFEILESRLFKRKLLGV
jgi:hypothetical protein